MKKPGKFNELGEIGEQLQYGIDEVGIVLKPKDENIIYRAIYSDKRNDTLEILNILEGKQFYNGKIIYAEISDKKTESFPLILRHPFINYCSNGGSWTLDMLINGIVTIIELLEELGSDELTLKDGHIFNLTYVNNQFQWIDFGSIIKGQIQTNVLKQMVESFVFPSILIINGYARDYYLISDKQRYMVKYYMIQSLLSEDEKVVFDKIYDSNNSFDNLVLFEELKAFINVYFSDKSIIESTEWENYQQLDLIDSESNLKQKKVQDYLSKSNGTTLIDIAGNKGKYCVYAAKKLNMTGVLIDYDYKCISGVSFFQ